MTERYVEVRVAVAVDSDGQFCAVVESERWYDPAIVPDYDRPLPTTPRGWIHRYGFLDEREDEEPMAYAWITARLPVPAPAEPEEVEASVEEVSE